VTNSHLLTAISPLDGRYANKVSDMQPIFSEFGLIKARVQVEIAWCEALFSCKGVFKDTILSKEALGNLNNISAKFSLADAEAIKAIESTTNHDVKAVEYWIAEQFKQHDELADLCAWIHFGCTSEDINNLAYGVMTLQGRAAILPAIDHLIEQFQSLAAQHADVAMLARTHGQTATPTSLGKECQNIAMRLRRARADFVDTKLYGKCNGATGNFNAHVVALPDVDWLALSAKMVSSLGLEWNGHTTQIEPHDTLAALLQALTRINTIIIDACRDFWQYISLGYFKQKTIQGEVGSSTMPHKVNPIDFENAEGNLGVANALANHLATKLPISRLQRDLSDSTVLRNLGTVFAQSLLAFKACSKGLSKCVANLDVIEADLAERWEVLAEAVQTMMRAHGVADAYDQLKAFTRGQQISKEMLHEFIQQLGIPESDKTRLLQLTPSSYIGLASKLAITT
jgi:adenylosuccinate lyase